MRDTMRLYGLLEHTRCHVQSSDCEVKCEKWTMVDNMMTSQVKAVAGSSCIHIYINTFLLVQVIVVTVESCNSFGNTTKLNKTLIHRHLPRQADMMVVTRLKRRRWVGGWGLGRRAIYWVGTEMWCGWCVKEFKCGTQGGWHIWVS